jgi:hypothetical protein
MGGEFRETLAFETKGFKSPGSQVVRPTHNRTCEKFRSLPDTINIRKFAGREGRFTAADALRSGPMCVS